MRGQEESERIGENKRRREKRRPESMRSIHLARFPLAFAAHEP